MAGGTLVGDLGPYHFIRLLFGYHSSPKLVKWHIVHTSVIAIFITCCITLTDLIGLTKCICLEYMLYIIISMIVRDKHLRHFYQRMPPIDSLPHAKAMYSNIRKHQIIAIWVWLAYRTASSMVGIAQSLVTVNFWSTDNFGRILMVLIYFGLDINQMNTIMILYLLYVRVIIIKRTIKSNGFNRNPIMAFSPRKYIQMYELLLDALHKHEQTLKIMTVIFLCAATYRLQLLIFVAISLFKVRHLIFLPVVMILGLVTRYVPFVCIVVLLDLVRDELTRIKMLTIQAYIKCKDERTRWEIKQLRTVLESHPLQYTLWRVVPLSLYLVLSTLSFWLITTMAIVQIRFR